MIAEDLSVILPGAKFTSYPWNPAIAVQYQVVVEIIQLDSELDKDLFLVAQWLVIDEKNKKTVIIKRTEFLRPIVPHNYAGLAATLSTACVSLSKEIAEALAKIETYSQTKPHSDRKRSERDS
jgi:uncharacterized lipoprotein YmbA